MTDAIVLVVFSLLYQSAVFLLRFRHVKSPASTQD
jgi:hypothetical protein